MNRRFDEDRAELEAHFTERIETYRDMGMPDEEATHLAQEKFGDLNHHLRQLRYQHYVARPLKAIRFALYWSVRSTFDSCVLCLIGAPIYWLVSLFMPGPNLFCILLGVAPILSMTDVGYRLDAQYSEQKHWGVLGVTLFWMSLYLAAALLFLPKNNQGNLHALWLLIPMLLGPAYIRFSWRRNAKPAA